MAVTYTTLVADKSTDGSIKNWVNNTIIPSGTILAQAEAHCYSLLRVREMRSSVTLSLNQGDSTVALPTGYLDPITLLNQSKDEIVLKDERSLEEMKVVDENYALIQSLPAYYAVFDEVINFDCAMQEAQPFRFLYFKQPTALGPSNPSNFLTNRYPHLLMAACQMYVADYLKNDTDYVRASQRAIGIVNDINIRDDLSYRGAMPNAEFRG